MKVLVTAGSKYGSTAEIAQAIGRALARHGIDVDVIPIEEANPTGYDAFVIGSAVYAGHWLRPAIDFVERNSEALRRRPVWVFSSGPIGDPAKPVDVPLSPAVIEATGASDHKVFAGKLDKSHLSFAEKAIVLALRAPEGDFRDWADVQRWADSIAASLRANAPD
jgi:menaquinone-dependent protoporphyrinogen oxidase